MKKILLATLLTIGLNADLLVVYDDGIHKVRLLGKFIKMKTYKSNDQSVFYLGKNNEPVEIKTNWAVIDFKTWNKMPKKYKRITK